MVEVAEREEPPKAIASSGAEVKFRLFVTLWAMAFSFHYLERAPRDAWLLVLSAGVCLLNPGSIAAFAAFVAVSTVVAAYQMPAASNHFVLGLMVNLVLLGGALGVLLAYRRASADRQAMLERWLGLVFTPVGLTLVVVYFFTVFHKLNTSFLDPSVSCAGSLFRRGLTRNGLSFDTPSWLVMGNAIGTLVCEALICLFLAVPRLRKWGVLLGIAFHGVLIWSGFLDFATFVFALYVLLIPKEAFGRVPNFDRLQTIAVGGWLVHLVFSTYATSGVSHRPLGLTLNALQTMLWIVVVAPMIYVLLKAAFAPAGEFPPLRWRWRPAWLLIVPLLAFLNGTTSYVGLKTVANYSMFSNLKTEEGSTNHLLPVGALEMAGFLRDTVDVHEFGIRDLGRFERGYVPYWLQRHFGWEDKTESFRLPWMELRRAANLWASGGVDVYVRFTHNGVTREVFDAAADPELGEPLPLPSRSLQAFREIEQGDGPVRCRW